MSGAIYPPRNCTIVLREPFPRVEYSPYKKYYIRACIDGMPEVEMRMGAEQQLSIVDKLIREDGKLLNAKVVCTDGQFTISEHSPQVDFFSLVNRTAMRSTQND